MLLLGGTGAAVCYLIAALSDVPLIGLFACALTGLCTSMLWPGSLVVSTAWYPAGGVLIYALMAAGGDMGASIGPQLVGLITDMVIANPAAAAAAEQMGLTLEQLGMKLGMLVGMIAPTASIAVYAAMHRRAGKQNQLK